MREDEKLLKDMEKISAGTPPAERSSNDVCLAFIIRSNGKSVLITGDVTSQVWNESLIALQSKPIKSDVITVTHHGSEHGNPVSFWDQVSHGGATGKKSVAVISCGYKNRYRHPSKKTLNRVLSRKNTLYCTNLGKPCKDLDVITPTGTPKILSSALSEINKTPLERALSGIAKPQNDICSGTVEMEIQSPGKVASTFREQASHCAYAKGKPHFNNVY
ncbi:MAG: hypothetical protein PHS14_05935 [Elusimicrobia bacterium]|nr:hypothetical protein [Elusimicrobiota bacterium]